MAKHGLEGVSIVWWMLTFTICPVHASKWLWQILFSLFLWLLGLEVKKEALNMAKHGLEGVSVVWWFMPIFTICRCICIKMALTDSFFTFLVVVGIRGEKEKLWTWQNMVWEAFCCLVIYTNLHRLPCICIKMVPTGIFSAFLRIVGINSWKRKLWTWQNMVWKAFLLFRDLF